MSARHPRAVEWERRLWALFREVDRVLEERYSGTWTRSDRRPAHGAIEDHESSGLFNVGATFSAGYGSAHGRGYVLQLSVGATRPPSPGERRALEQEAADLVREALPRFFPGQRLEVSRDGELWKIHGDLRLKA